MREIDIAVVGSGIGGTLISALLSHKNLILFEKEPNLGGCASTFMRYGHRFNAGATTFVGYEEGHIIKEMFERIGIEPQIQQSDIAIRIKQGTNTLDRVQNFEEFLSQIDKIYPHKNNRIFWESIKDIDEKFWKIKNIFLSKYSLKAYLKSFLCFMSLVKTYKFLLFRSAASYIEEVLYDISDAYKAFIDAQLLITVQTTHEKIPLLSLALGLSYPFHKVFYATGGMGAIIEKLTQNVLVKKEETILSIKREKEFYILQSNKESYKAKKLILNSTIYDSAKLFEDRAIKRYYESFSFSDQSAFVTYLHVKSEKELLHHYQILLEESIPNAISRSFFVSFSDKSDTKLSIDGLSVTISTHTKATFWENLSKEEYKKKKQETQEFILNAFQKEFPHVKVEKAFSATSKTFSRYIRRSNCGGQAMHFKNMLSTPTCTTPFKNLYNVGDTIFAGQGWPGVALGVSVLHEELR
jgi:phytoene dehydrogenase-like protein